jgi:hypothetical protein
MLMLWNLGSIDAGGHFGRTFRAMGFIQRVYAEQPFPLLLKGQNILKQTLFSGLL